MISAFSCYSACRKFVLKHVLGFCARFLHQIVGECDLRPVQFNNYNLKYDLFIYLVAFLKYFRAFSWKLENGKRSKNLEFHSHHTQKDALAENG